MLHEWCIGVDITLWLQEILEAVLIDINVNVNENNNNNNSRVTNSGRKQKNILRNGQTCM